MKKSRILIADDHDLFRDGVASMINAQPNLEVVGRAEDGLEVFSLARELEPDLIIMDVNMPISDGLEATRLIHNAYPQISILILTVHEEEEKLFEAIKAGAIGYMLKNSNSDDFLDGIRRAIDGEAVLPPMLARQLLEEFAILASRPKSTPNEDTMPLLTSREREVLELIMADATNKEISERLSISLYTTKSHVRNILSKLQVASRKQAARVALRDGLISNNTSSSDST
ncbi:MAG: response regulator transcription factor [Chloroflexota bacterium]|nr:MAG: response regulator transcription factor [Chloroflexota bacterium]